LKILDSGFRQNDKENQFWTFYESVNFEEAYLAAFNKTEGLIPVLPNLLFHKNANFSQPLWAYQCQNK